MGSINNGQIPPIQPGQFGYVVGSGSGTCLTGDPTVPNNLGRVTAQACQIGNQNQLWASQTQTINGVVVPVLVSQGGLCASPCLDDPNTLCAALNQPNCNSFSNPFVNVDTSTINIVSSQVSTATLNVFVTVTSQTLAIVTTTVASLTTQFIDTTIVLNQALGTTTVTEFTTPTASEGASSTTTVTTVVTETFTIALTESGNLGRRRYIAPTRRAGAIEHLPSASVFDEEFVYQEDNEEMPIWAFALLGSLGFVAAVCAGAVAIVLHSRRSASLGEETTAASSVCVAEKPAANV